MMAIKTKTHEQAIDRGEMVATFLRARFASRCCNCGAAIVVGEQIHWMRDARRTWVSHPGECPAIHAGGR